MSEAAVLDAPATTLVTGESTLTDATKPADTPADGATGDAAAKSDVKADAKAEEKVDEKPIEYSFKMPEGIELDKAATDEFVAFAKELKLPADQAQKVVDIAVRREQARVEQHKATVAQWASDVKADKEIGGDKLAENLSIAKKAIDLGPPELKEFLNATGFGNHPAIVKWALSVGKKLSEDRFVSSTGGSAASTDVATSFYPTMTQKG